MLIQTRGLVVSQQGRALGQALTFTLDRGTMIWVRGENGVGKSTLLKTLLGLQRPFEGEYEWDSPKPACFYLSHTLGLAPNLTVLEHCYWHPVTGRPSGDAIMRVLSRLNLGNKAHQFCDTLSRGQQQRLSMAIALLSNTTVWLLDEPFTALDPASIETVKLCLQAHIEQGGGAIVVSHHDLQKDSNLIINMQEAQAC